MLRLILLIHPKKIDKTLVESVKLGKTLELSKIMRMSFLMLDRVNWGHHLGSSYIFEESSHTKSRLLVPFPLVVVVGGGWWLVGVKSGF